MASYLVLDMGVDWRQGADWFETVLQDYDVCSNWGNWVAAAGFTGGRINHFNIAKQSKVSSPICHSLPIQHQFATTYQLNTNSTLVYSSSCQSTVSMPDCFGGCRTMTRRVTTSGPGFQS